MTPVLQTNIGRIILIWYWKRNADGTCIGKIGMLPVIPDLNGRRQLIAFSFILNGP